MAGTTTAPIWFSGYNTTPGDLDTDTTNALAKPVWTFNTGFSLITSGVQQVWSGLSVVASINAATWTVSGGQKLLRVRSENTGANSGSIALGISSNGIVAAYSFFKSPTTATAEGVVSGGGSSSTFIGCIAQGGGFAGFQGTSGGHVYIECVATGVTGSGFKHSTATRTMVNCTAYNVTADGAVWTGTPPVGCSVVGCLFTSCGGYGLNNASGTNSANIVRSCNDFYSCTSGNENGMGDSPAIFGQTESSSPVTSSTDMTPVVGSNALNHGFPGIFENQTYSSLLAIGAVQPGSGPVGRTIARGNIGTY